VFAGVDNKPGDSFAGFKHIFAVDEKIATMNANSLAQQMQRIGAQARLASREMAKASGVTKNRALNILATKLRTHQSELIKTNERDCLQAVANEVSETLIDRLRLSEKIIETSAQGCEQLAAMPEVIGEIHGLREQPSGIRVGQMRVPIGVFGMIYESRPNVTIEAASLSIKSGNACILRPGSESFDSCTALARLVRESLLEARLPSDAVQLVSTTDREAVGHLITMSEYVDVIIPRGGKSLIERISREAKVPVIKHLDGNCHTFVDQGCDLEMAWRVCENAKTQKYSPCNAMESLLVHEQVAQQFLPKMAGIFARAGVELRCCPKTLEIVREVKGLTFVLATEQDWYEEYLAPILSVKIIQGVDEAIEHINTYSSHHTDAILTQNFDHAQRFLRAVDSSSVMVNASTRFADGFEYGLGAEIGISTDKFHARGPVGIEGLTSLKYVVLGQGEVRS
jgi:glutamate-5-semialdehyde dehydrogenase